MKHSIRQRVLDPVTGLKVTKIEQVNGELGSGIVDKNGREIFEGDRVKVTNERGERTGLVTYRDGHFGVEGASIYARLEGVYGGLEVIGHVDD